MIGSVDKTQPIKGGTKAVNKVCVKRSNGGFSIRDNNLLRNHTKMMAETRNKPRATINAT